MSFSHFIDLDHRILTIQFEGEVEGRDILESCAVMVQLTRQYPEYRHVWDGMHITMLDVEYKDLLRIVALIREEMLPAFDTCPGSAVFLKRQVDYLVVKTIHLMLGAPEPFVVIRDPVKAQEWIAQHV